MKTFPGLEGEGPGASTPTAAPKPPVPPRRPRPPGPRCLHAHRGPQGRLPSGSLAVSTETLSRGCFGIAYLGSARCDPFVLSTCVSFQSPHSGRLTGMAL